MSHDDVETRVRSYLCGSVGLDPGTDSDDALFTAGVLDSMDFVGLIEFLENEFAIVLSSFEVGIEDVDSVKMICQTVTSRG